MSNYTYKHVALIGVDGAGVFFRDTETPNIDKIIENGAVSYDVLTAEPTISADCWGSMLICVKPEVHGLTNDILSSKPYDIESKYPSVFRVIRENMPEATLASFSNWSPINSGLVENNLNVYKESSWDADLTEKICTYLKENGAPTFMFVQFDEVDGAGHCHGYRSEKYLNQITVEDGFVGRILDVYKELGALEDTLFIVTADHGGLGTSHGGSSDDEKIVMFSAIGKTVKNGTIGEMEIRDTPAIILHALGLTQPTSWTARIPENFYVDVPASERPLGE